MAVRVGAVVTAAVAASNGVAVAALGAAVGLSTAAAELAWQALINKDMSAKPIMIL
jgi:hypothetical protein